MDPVSILALVSAAISLAEKLPAAIHALKQSGEMTPDQEAALDAKIADLQTAHAPEYWKL